jgi:hypothetical protein
MSKFLKTIEGCPEGVRAFVAQTILTNEMVRILDEIGRFKRMAIAYGHLEVEKVADNASAVFVCALDSLTDDKTEAA